MYSEHPDDWDHVADAVIDLAQDVADRISDWRDSHRQDDESRR